MTVGNDGDQAKQIDGFFFGQLSEFRPISQEFTDLLISDTLKLARLLIRRSTNELYAMSRCAVTLFKGPNVCILAWM